MVCFLRFLLLILLFVFFFFYSCMVEKVFFWREIFKMEILMDLLFFEGFWIWKSYFLRLVCMCVCYQHNSKTYSSRNFKFSIVSYVDPVWNFSWRPDKICVQRHPKAFLYITAYGGNFLLVHFSIYRLPCI